MTFLSARHFCFSIHRSKRSSMRASIVDDVVDDFSFTRYNHIIKISNVFEVHTYVETNLDEICPLQGIDV